MDTHIAQCRLMSHVLVICKIECITVQLVTQSNKLIQHPKVLEITYNVKTQKLYLDTQSGLSLRYFKFPSTTSRWSWGIKQLGFLSVLYFSSIFYKGSKESALSKYSGTSIDLMNLYITNDFFQPTQNYNKMYRTDPWYNDPWFNKILIIRNTIQKCKRKIYLCNESILTCNWKIAKDECETDQQG